MNRSPDAPLADTDLVLRSRTGDAGAFAQLWQRHYSAGLTVARSITSTVDPDDLVQEAYTRIFQAIRRGGGPTGAFRAYLFTAIRNTAASWGRGHREFAIEELEAVADPSSTEESRLEEVDRGLTHRAFRSLPTRWQEVLWYTEVEGLGPAEAAPLLGMKPGAVKQLAFRAREGLREAWIQAHIAALGDGSECRWAVEHLGAHARGNLTPRNRSRIEAHLADCGECAALAGEAEEVGSRLALALLPVFIGVTSTASYLASLRGEGAVLAIAAMPSGVVEGAVAAGGGITAAGTALTAGSATGGATTGGAVAAAAAAGTTGAFSMGGLVGAGMTSVGVAGTLLAATIVPALAPADASAAVPQASVSAPSTQAPDPLPSLEDDAAAASSGPVSSAADPAAIGPSSATAPATGAGVAFQPVTRTDAPTTSPSAVPEPTATRGTSPSAAPRPTASSPTSTPPAARPAATTPAPGATSSAPAPRPSTAPVQSSAPVNKPAPTTSTAPKPAPTPAKSTPPAESTAPSPAPSVPGVAVGVKAPGVADVTAGVGAGGASVGADIGGGTVTADVTVGGDGIDLDAGVAGDLAGVGAEVGDGIDVGVSVGGIDVGVSLGGEGGLLGLKLG